MNYCDIGSARIANKVIGSGNKTFVIDTCLGSCSAEWWHISEALSKKGKVIVYDRAGYGKSSVSTLKRTPQNIAIELNKLLNTLRIENDIILIGHSQGGLNAIEFSLMYPDCVKGLILLDPATPFDNEFKEFLTAEEYKKSGVDKTASLKMIQIITSFGLGFALKPLFIKAPPFYYYDFTNESKSYLLQALCKNSTYKTALEEYHFAYDEMYTNNIVNAINNSSLEHVKIKIITHSSEFYVKELEHYGNLDTHTSEKIESIWQDLMKRYLSLSDDSEHITAPNSGHYIHLTDLEVLLKVVESFIE